MKISVGLRDIKDCFHRMKQPCWLSEYFSLDAIPVTWVSLQNTLLDGRILEAGDYVWPSPGLIVHGIHLVALLRSES